MSKIDRFPSTPVKLITGWLAFVAMFAFSLVAMARGWKIDEMLFFGTWGGVFTYNGIAFGQFWAKRSTAWPSPVTKSEATTPAADGQPADPAPTDVAKPATDWVEVP